MPGSCRARLVRSAGCRDCCRSTSRLAHPLIPATFACRRSGPTICRQRWPATPTRSRSACGSSWSAARREGLRRGRQLRRCSPGTWERGQSTSGSALARPCFRLPSLRCRTMEAMDPAARSFSRRLHRSYVLFPRAPIGSATLARPRGHALLAALITSCAPIGGGWSRSRRQRMAVCASSHFVEPAVGSPGWPSEPPA